MTRRRRTVAERGESLVKTERAGEVSELITCEMTLQPVAGQDVLLLNSLV